MNVIIATRAIGGIEDNSGTFSLDNTYIIQLNDGSYAFASTQETTWGTWSVADKDVTLIEKGQRRKATVTGRLELTDRAEAYLRRALRGKSPEEQQAILQDLYQRGDRQLTSSDPSFGAEVPVPNNGSIESIEAFMVVQGLSSIRFSNPDVKAAGRFSEFATDEGELPRYRNYWIAKVSDTDNYVVLSTITDASPEGVATITLEGDRVEVEITDPRLLDYEAAVYLSWLEQNGLNSLFLSELDEGVYLSHFYYAKDHYDTIRREDVLTAHEKLFPETSSLMKELSLWQAGHRFPISFDQLGDSSPTLRAMLEVFDELQGLLLGEYDEAKEEEIAAKYKEAFRLLRKLNNDFFKPRGLFLTMQISTRAKLYLLSYRIEGKIEVEIKRSRQETIRRETVDVLRLSRIDSVRFDERALGITERAEESDQAYILVEQIDGYYGDDLGLLSALSLHDESVHSGRETKQQDVAIHEACHVAVPDGGEKVAYLCQVGFGNFAFQALAKLLYVHIGSEKLDATFYRSLFSLPSSASPAPTWRQIQIWTSILQTNRYHRDDREEVDAMTSFLQGIDSDSLQIWAKDILVGYGIFGVSVIE
ncbi:MAG: hypothetical protein ABIE84_06905 [bacterium]